MTYSIMHTSHATFSRLINCNWSVLIIILSDVQWSDLTNEQDKTSVAISLGRGAVVD